MKSPRPAYSLCLCPDSHLLKGRIEALLSAHPPASGTWQRHVFWADEGLTPAFWEHVTLQGLFAASKALVLRNAQNLNADALRQLSPFLEKLAANPAASTDTWPIICFECPFERGEPKLAAHIRKMSFFVLAEERRWLDLSAGLTPQTLPAYIRAESLRHGLSLTSAEAERLARVLPPDAAAASSELAKLALTADAEGKPASIGSGQADAVLAGYTPEIGIFELLRSIQQNGNRPAVWRRVLEDRLSGESVVFAFLAVLLREARVLWQLLAGESVNLPSRALEEKTRTARTLGLPGVARIWELALATEKGIKSGEHSPDQALEKLVADMFILFHTRLRS